jgi:hypothetical protein
MAKVVGIVKLYRAMLTNSAAKSRELQKVVELLPPQKPCKQGNLQT